MSNSLAIATVTAALRRLLAQNLSVPGAEALSLRPADFAQSADDPALNVYLYQVVPNPALRNADLATRDSAGNTVQRPTAALNLHYLISCRGSENRLEPQRLLGSAVQSLHAHPQLTRADLQAVIDDAAADPMSTEAFLADSDLDEQVERLRFSPVPMNLEELSKLWSVFFQTTYVLSMVYEVSVVLIEAPAPTRSPLPVLTRGLRVQPHLGPAFPTLSTLRIPQGRPYAHLGDVLVLEGFHLGGTPASASLSHPRLDPPLVLAVDSLSDTRAGLSLPGDPAVLPAGVWRLRLRIPFGTEPGLRESNEMAFVVAPRITTAMPMPVIPILAGQATLNLAFQPEVLPEQSVSLVLGEREISAPEHPSPTGTLSFVIADALAGDYRLRLRVDGVDSLIVNYEVQPPAFLALQVTLA